AHSFLSRSYPVTISHNNLKQGWSVSLQLNDSRLDNNFSTMSEGLTTSRPLQNEATGIDLHVPLYKEIRGTMMTGHVEYQIIVVTRMAAFKSAKHKPEDIVQLVVSKKYSEIDEFYNKLICHYPKTTLPAMPRKALFVSEADIRERRVAFDELVKFISKNSLLANCPEVLEFLGAKSTVADLKTRTVADRKERDVEEEGFDFFERDETASAARVTKHDSPVKLSEEEKHGDGNDEVKKYVGPLGNIKCTEQTKTTQPNMATLFKANNEDVNDNLFHAAAKDLNLFEDSAMAEEVKLGDSLLPPTAYNDVASENSELNVDMNELFRIEDNFDKLLHVHKIIKAKPVVSPKPKLDPKSKPALPVKPSLISDVKGQVRGQVEGVPPVVDEINDQMDILKYIQQNESTACDTLDLF
ncbi:hypothetical protein UPYG_G00230400, partial [Umbra pygmaea]